MEKESVEEPWVVLSGCNACINSTVCAELGNCVLLTLDTRFPLNNKSKKKMIQRLRNNSMSVDTRRLYLSYLKEEMKLGIQKKAWEDEYVQTWNNSIKLTVIEKMCIEQLNRPR